MDTTVLLGQKDSLLNNPNGGPADADGDNSSDVEEYCTATSKLEEDDAQMTDGTATTSNTNRYLTGREKEEDDDDDDGDDETDDDETDYEEDVTAAAGQEDSEATVTHSMPSPSTERKSNLGRSRNGGGSGSSSNLCQLSRIETMDTTAADLSTLEEGSCETSLNTTAASGVGRSKRRGSNGDNDTTQGPPSQCQSLVGHIKTMERRLDTALADAMRSPSPRLDTSGRSGLDQSCAIPQGGDVEADEEEGPVFGSQGLSPIMLEGSQLGPTIENDGDECEEEDGSDDDGKPVAQQISENPDLTSKPSSPSESDGKKRKATPSDSAHSLRESTKASSDECKPRVFFLSHSTSLSAANVRTVRKCVKSNKLGLFGGDTDHPNATDNSDFDIPYDFETPDGVTSFISAMRTANDTGETIYGISTETEFQYTDGHIVPRSFRYLMAVAASLPMVDISFLSNNSNFGSSRGPMGRYLMPPGAGSSHETNNDGTDVGGRTKRARRGASDNIDPYRDPQSACPYVVCGDSDAKEIGAPQRSIASKQGIFYGYTFLLFGEFDHVSSTTSKAGGRRRRGAATSITAKVNDSNLYSQGRLTVLIRLCGGAVAGLKNVIEATEEKAGSSSSATRVSPDVCSIVTLLQSPSCRRSSDNIVVLVKRKANTKDYSQARRLLKDHGDSLGLVDASKIPVLRADWVLDSISDYGVRDLDGYSFQDAK